MSTKTIQLIGAGGHAKVVVDALRALFGIGVDLEVLDDSWERVGSDLSGVIVKHSSAFISGARFHVAIGADLVRSERFTQLLQLGGRPLTIVHPDASVSPSAVVDEGVFIGAKAVLGPNCAVGQGTIVNHGAIVDHDCTAGRFCHVAPGAILGGGVKLDDRVMLGTGSVVMPGLSITSDVTVGAGAVVTKPIRYAGTYVGTPARKLSRN
jgi:sugar O-acyltransferase (sialic acid O-acetyltransferase NeuD family)